MGYEKVLENLLWGS